MPWLTNLNTFITWHTLCRIFIGHIICLISYLGHSESIIGQTLPESHGPKDDFPYEPRRRNPSSLSKLFEGVSVTFGSQMFEKSRILLTVNSSPTSQACHQQLRSPTSRTQESEDLRKRTNPVANGWGFPVSHPFDFLYIHLHKLWIIHTTGCRRSDALFTYPYRKDQN